jgi:lipopolysaccharide cholinephosphotransferase
VEKPLIIYTAGRYGRDMLAKLSGYGVAPIAFCDSDGEKRGKTVEGVRIVPVEDILGRYGRDGVKIIVAAGRYFKVIEHKLRSLGVPDENILSSLLEEYLETGRIAKPGAYTPEQLSFLRKCLFDMLCRVHDICERHGLRYHLAAGTLLGAARHGGFIPWDDDADVTMFRGDYEAFFKLCGSELPGRFVATDGMARKICIRDSRKRYPSPRLSADGVGMDVFALDNVLGPDRLATRLQYRAKLFAADSQKYASGLGKVCNGRIGRFPYWLMSLLPGKTPERLADRAVRAFNRKDTGYVYDFVLIGGYRANRVFRRDCYAQRALLDFEGKKFWAPGGYREMLRLEYGDDWMELPPAESRFPLHSPVDMHFGVLQDEFEAFRPRAREGGK